MTEQQFNEGDEIKFITEDNRVTYIYKTSGIDGIIHGNTVFKENKGTIINKQGKWYLVSYISEVDKEVRLGFKADVLQLVNKKQQSQELIFQIF